MVLFASAPTAAQERSQRIVSLNLCTDQLLMLLVERERIAGLTVLAADPTVSALAEQAAGLPTTRGTAEEVLALDPDLVLAGVYTTRPTVTLLRRFGARVVELEPETSLADIPRNIAVLGEAVGEPERAQALIDEFDAALAATRVETTGPRPVFANIQPNGWVSGGGTLVADVAHAAGFKTLGERLGYRGARQVSLEQLVVSAPDVLAIGDAWDGTPALAGERLRHPALRRLAASRTSVEIPDPLWACGGPFTLDAVRAIAATRPER